MPESGRHRWPRAHPATCRGKGLQSHGKRGWLPPPGWVSPFGRFDGGSNTGSLCPGHLDGGFGPRTWGWMVQNGREGERIHSLLLLTPPRLITLQSETKERCCRVLSAAIYTSLSGKGLQAPSWFPEMKVQTSLPNSPNQQLPPAPRLDIPGPPELPRTPRPHAPAQQTHVHELCCSNMQVRE